MSIGRTHPGLEDHSIQLLMGASSVLCHKSIIANMMVKWAIFHGTIETMSKYHNVVNDWTKCYIEIYGQIVGADRAQLKPSLVNI